MGEARHHGIREKPGAFCQNGLEILDLLVERIDRVAHIEAEVDGDRVVARARRVQAAGVGADVALGDETDSEASGVATAP